MEPESSASICRISKSIVFVLGIVFLTSCVGNTRSATVQDGAVSGFVKDESGPLALATVRVQATELSALTDLSGEFVLTGIVPGQIVTISAWKDGYYCAKSEGIRAPARNVRITLIRYQEGDNPDYLWIPPVGKESCASCKPEITAIWLENAHAKASLNPRFLSMYNGTDLAGNKSPPTRYFTDRDYGELPLPPAPDKPYYGPGYNTDFPDKKGNCAACHTPGPALNDPYQTDPNLVSGPDTYGVHCDFCHKIADVDLNPETGLPFPARPGVLSLDLRRPFPDDPRRYQLFFGTFDDDNVPEEDTYLPLIEKSEFCAACHYGIFWDTSIYNSFGEWLDSPYGNPDTGKTCQQCHMPSPTIYRGEVLTNVAQNAGGIERDPRRIHAHLQLGSQDEHFLQEAFSMETRLAQIEDNLIIRVKLINDNTGHHIPTDSPLRHLMLIVRAIDAEGADLPLIRGGRLPEWCGLGEYSEGAYADYPGKVYAKILEEVWTGISPTASYWNPTVVVEDTRLKAAQSDTTQYIFSNSKGLAGRILIRVWYRRAFYDLMRQKGWKTPDTLLKEAVLEF